MTAVLLLVFAVGMYIGSRVVMDCYQSHMTVLDAAGQRLVETERTMRLSKSVRLTLAGQYAASSLPGVYSELSFAASNLNYHHASTCGTVLPCCWFVATVASHTYSRSPPHTHHVLAFLDLFFAAQTGSSAIVDSSELRAPTVPVTVYPTVGSSYVQDMSMWDAGRELVRNAFVVLETRNATSSSGLTTDQLLSFEFIDGNADNVIRTAFTDSLTAHTSASYHLAYSGQIVFGVLCASVLCAIVLLSLFVFAPAVQFIQLERNRIVRVFGLIPPHVVRALAKSSREHAYNDEDNTGMTALFSSSVVLRFVAVRGPACVLVPH